MKFDLSVSKIIPFSRKKKPFTNLNYAKFLKKMLITFSIWKELFRNTDR